MEHAGQGRFPCAPLVTVLYRGCVDEGRVGHGFPVWNMLLGYVSHVLLGKFRVTFEIGKKMQILTPDAKLIWIVIQFWSEQNERIRIPQDIKMTLAA